MRALRTSEGTKIESFVNVGESFSALQCFDGSMGDERVTLLVIDVTHYDESVAELISPAHLREALGLRDGDAVRFQIG